MDQKTQQGHGYFRKSKAYGLVSGIALGTLLWAGAQVSAEEQTPQEPAVEVVAPAAAEEAPVETVTNDASGVVTTTTGATTTVDTVERQEAVANAKKEGISVTEADTEKLGTTKTAEEQAALEAQAKAKIDAEAAEVERVTKDHQANVARAEADATKEGYAEKVINQSILFKSEPQAIAKITTSGKTTQASVSLGNGAMLDETTEGTNIYDLKEGDVVTVEYTNLENATYAGQKIAKVIYEYTLKENIAGIRVYNDPTVTVYTITNQGAVSTRLGMLIKFYDQNGKQMAFSKTAPGALAFNSLNKGEVWTESITNLSDNIEFVHINGSTVYLDNGTIAARTPNNFKSEGSRFDANPATDPNHFWDGVEQPNRWYGAGIGLVTSGDAISFDIYNKVEGTVANASTRHTGYWFAFNTDIASSGVVTNPSVSTTTFTYDSVGAVTTVHVAKDGTVLVPKAMKESDKPVGSAYDVSQHEDTLVTADGKTYQFVEVTPNATGNIKLGTTDVVFTYDEVKGSVLVEYKDTKGNVLKEPVVDTPEASTGTDYDTTDHKPKVIEKDGKIYLIIPKLTEGAEQGKVQKGQTTITYIYQALETLKGVTNDKGENVDGGQLTIGEKGRYALTGASVPGAAFADGKGEYSFEDDLNEKHDRYLSSELTLLKEITLRDGTLLKAGTDLLPFVTEDYDGNIYRVALKSDFLASIADESEFQAQVMVHFERIAAGEVTNTFSHTVNGEVVTSNTVVTTTPEPEKPVTPEAPKETPKQPTPATPVAPASVLPQTGEVSSVGLLVSGLISAVAALGLAGRKRKED
ncbi:GbpC/Spa domain-containing protein [Streptococcus merionis]|uniref:GbpC/Spa domain-containing protein n=1 Tax=Streptococcus merionis TaxID=400065 RepID=UPI0026F11762|nr:GbpC/Spa domain-containing protein [Streptococcus merionis]